MMILHVSYLCVLKRDVAKSINKFSPPSKLFDDGLEPKGCFSLWLYLVKKKQQQHITIHTYIAVSVLYYTVVESSYT